MQPETIQLILDGNVKKGDVVRVAEIAGVMGAKQTGHLIPLCHPLALDQIELRCTPDPTHNRVLIEATARVTGKTGVEMEALTAVSVAALTIYDMAKAVDRSMTISEVRLVYKSGGRSGTFEAADWRPE